MNKIIQLVAFVFFSFFMGLGSVDAQNWVQRGQNFDGSRENERLGTSARMNGDGSIIAIGSVSAAYVNGAPNNVKIYEYQSGIWVQKGSTISGAKGDQLGISLDLSEDGNRIVIGADQRANASEDTNGYITVYKWNGADWQQLGDRIIDTTVHYLGDDVSISGNGAVITASSEDYGARVYFWNGIIWEKRGQNIPLYTGNKPQEGLSLNYDGSILAAAGQVYFFNGDSWIPMGNPVGGYAMALSASGEQVISGSYWEHFAVIHEWDGNNWKLKGDSIKVNGIGARIYAVTISSDGNTIAYSSPASSPEQMMTYDWDGSKWSKRANLRFGGNHGALNYYTKSIDLSNNGKYAIAGRNLADDGGITSSGRVSVHTWCNNTEVIIDSITTCGSSYTWPRNGLTYYSSISHSYDGKDADGCDQEYKIVLTFSDTTLVDTTVHLCDQNEFTWEASGLTYTEEGVFKDTLNRTDCPIIYTMNLTKGNSNLQSESQLICDSYYYWPVNKQVYTKSGTYQEIYTNQEGCDSIVSLELELYPIPNVEKTHYECSSSYTWPANGTVYTRKGTYTDSTTSRLTGCDSINTLHLHFQETVLDTSVKAYFSFKSPFTNTEYTTSNVYVENFDLNGCEVVYTIDLEILPSDPLKGTYTIDQNGEGDFVSFSNVVEVMRQIGIDGPVLFEAKEGLYTETFTIDSIAGSSSVNTVTFQGENNNVIIMPGVEANLNSFILLESVSNICFKNLQFIHNESVKSNMLVLQRASNICVENCSFIFNYDEENYEFYYGIRALNVSGLSVLGNTFYGGVSALYSSQSKDILFENNDAQDIWFDNTSNFKIFNNTFKHSGYAYAISLFDVTGYTIQNNTIYPGGYNTYSTLYISNDSPVAPSVISNNFIYTPEALNFSTTDSLLFYHNTLVSDEGGLDLQTTSSNSYSLTNSAIKNNIFYTNGEQAVITATKPFDNVAVDNNLYFTTGATLISYGGTDYADLTSWKTAFPAYDQNAQFFEPQFKSPEDYHISSGTEYRFGDPAVGLAFDIDREPRDLTKLVDVGADQFSDVINNASVVERESLFSAYPIPVENLLNLESKQKVVSAEVLALDGRLLYNIKSISSPTLNLGHLPSGLFILKVSFEDGTHQTLKITKQ